LILGLHRHGREELCDLRRVREDLLESPLGTRRDRRTALYTADRLLDDAGCFLGGLRAPAREDRADSSFSFAFASRRDVT